MIDPARRRRLAGGSAWLLLSLALVILRLLPLWPGRVGWPGPDLMLALTLAWVMRRPEQAPVAAIGAIFLVEGLLTMRPPGLWAAIVVAGTEAARLREARWREQPFLVEWLRVAILMLGMMICNRLVEAALFVPAEMSPRPPLGQMLLQFIATVAVYPPLVWMVRGAPSSDRAGEAG